MAEVGLLATQPVPCALCGGARTRVRYVKFGLPIAQCVTCGLVYANPRASQEAIWERYTQEYFWTEYLPAVVAGGVVDLEIEDARHAPMLTLIRGHSGRSRGRLLEIGAGAGFFLKAAERAGWAVCGVELSDDGATFARDRLGLDVRHAPVETVDFGDARFHVIVMFDVIEHLLEPMGVVGAARRLLVPGGLLVVTTPNFNALSRTALGAQWAVLSPLEHVYYFTEKSLVAFLGRAGFAEVQSVRQHPSFGAVETMNYLCTHAPHSWRSKIYEGFVRAFGRRAFRFVQACGRGDQLVCLART